MTGFDDLAQQVAYALQLALACVFLLSVTPKLRRPRAFATTVESYDLLPAAAARATGWAVIAIELLLMVSFFTGWLLAPALGIAVVTLLGFGGSAAVNLRRGRRVVCGCFGSSAERISRRSLFRVALLIIAVLALAALLATDTVAPVTMSQLAEAGTPALAFVINIAGAAAFLLLASMWLLTGPELRAVLRGPGDMQRDREGM